MRVGWRVLRGNCICWYYIGFRCIISYSSLVVSLVLVSSCGWPFCALVCTCDLYLKQHTERLLNVLQISVMYSLLLFRWNSVVVITLYSLFISSLLFQLLRFVASLDNKFPFSYNPLMLRYRHLFFILLVFNHHHCSSGAFHFFYVHQRPSASSTHLFLLPTLLFFYKP